MNKKQWMPLIGMTIAAFIFNTSEFMPIGLLTDIAHTFSITQTQAGIMITIYSWAVMLLSLPLMILASKYNYKKILLVTLFLFGLGQAISATSTNFLILIIGRLIVACAHAIFWSIASVIAVRLVNEDKREFAMSMIVTGTSVAIHDCRFTTRKNDWSMDWMENHISNCWYHQYRSSTFSNTLLP